MVSKLRTKNYLDDLSVVGDRNDGWLYEVAITFDLLTAGENLHTSDERL